MRIVGGRLKGRTLKAPKGENIRPTADRIRESIFNMLVHRIDGCLLKDVAVIDVFCGTGALGLEAISRGAKYGIFIDNKSSALKSTRANSRALGLDGEVITLKLNAGRLKSPTKLVKFPAALAFLDPPYNKGLVSVALSGLRDKGWLESGAFCVVEIASKELFEVPKNFKVLLERKFGAARILFLQMDSL